LIGADQKIVLAINPITVGTKKAPSKLMRLMDILLRKRISFFQK